MRRLIITAAAVLATLGPVLADGLPVPPHQAYPLPPPPQPSQSCLMTALQMGYLTGRREVAYGSTLRLAYCSRGGNAALCCRMFIWAALSTRPSGYGPPEIPSPGERPMKLTALFAAILLAFATAASAHKPRFAMPVVGLPARSATDSNGHPDVPRRQRAGPPARPPSTRTAQRHFVMPRAAPPAQLHRHVSATGGCADARPDGGRGRCGHRGTMSYPSLFKRLRRRRPLQLKCKVCGGVLR